MAFENIFDSSLIDYSKDFEQTDINSLINSFVDDLIKFISSNGYGDVNLDPYVNKFNRKKLPDVYGDFYKEFKFGIITSINEYIKVLNRYKERNTGGSIRKIDSWCASEFSELVFKD